MRTTHPQHGGDLSAAGRRFGSPPSGWIDLSTGINPWPYPDTTMGLEAVARLPQQDETEALLLAPRDAYGIPSQTEVAARTAGLLLAAILLDAVIGDPRWLYRIVPHPTEFMGRALSFCDGRFNRPESSANGRRVAGAVSTLAIVGSFGALGAFISAGLNGWRGGFWVEAFLVSVLIAQNSLYRHVAEVARALERDGVEAGRSAVAHIVGRDPESLDAHGVARSAVESLAENFGDGVAAPVLWGLILGLPGIIAYKALNTADSMIGHLDRRYREFGWAAARLDNVANWVPARVAGFIGYPTGRPPHEGRPGGR